ncbi:MULTISPECIES: hypothetical protein [unclassified Mesorhizobium]|uniref:hypothetical protein n=1 Tax=unclassified Mesorhizobium TaxID=325217 RepID=UPI000FD20EA3|nr:MULTISPECIES: hypothetical protein [unclassified Mesorhizobium]TGP59542.1 hypothetical protein EN869_014825 [Mesorhizobium sp. M2D.F.Ca.ET.226.01.1.1]
MAAVSDMYHAHSAFAAQQDMSNLEQTQLDALYKATGTRLPAVFPGAFYPPSSATGPYQQDFMHYIAGDDTVNDTMRQEYRTKAEAQIVKYDELAQQHGLLTYEQMFKQVQLNARQKEADALDVAGRATDMGVVGDIAGSVVGSMTPRDPINMATLALGGAGKTILARVGAQIGMNSVAEAGELISGSADTQRLLLGKDALTPEDEAVQIAAAGLGAGVLHLGGEGAAAGLRAIAKRFGAAAPDIASAALAHEAGEAIGPSPYGTSRIAEGTHTGQVLDALRRDTPLNLPGLASSPPSLSPAALASRESDELFGGTSAPLSRLLDRLPNGVDASAVANTNRQLAELTARIGETGKAAAELDTQIQARQESAIPADEIFRKRAKLADLNAQIADTTDKRSLGQLSRDKAQAETALASGEAANANLQALVARRQDIGNAADTLRLQRSKIVADFANGAGAKKSTALGSVDSGLGPVGQTRSPSPSDAIERELAKASAGDGPKVRIIPPEPPKAVAEGAAPQPTRPPAGQFGSGEMIELGQRSGAIDMDTVIPFGRDADGNVETRSIRDILAELKSHDDLVQAMNECLI